MPPYRSLLYSFRYIPKLIAFVACESVTQGELALMLQLMVSFSICPEPLKVELMV